MRHLRATTGPRLARMRSLDDNPKLARYARDPFAHLEDGHVVILDLETLEETPLHPYDHQREILGEWIDLDRLVRTGVPRFRNTHEEKSRQMGVTWILAWAVLWLLTYHTIPGLVLHLDLSEVDDGGDASTTNSFFGKVRFMWAHAAMPEHFKAPLSFRMRPSIIRNRLRPNAYVIGGAATTDPGRGGRYGYVILDEAARIRWGESVHKALRSACPSGRFYNSTPKGKSNVYYRLREQRPKGYRFMRHHWTIHPVYGRGQHIAGSQPQSCKLCEGNVARVRYDPNNPRCHRYLGKVTSDWYEQAITDMTDEQVAAELDIDYAGSLAARVYPGFQAEVHVVDLGDHPWDREAHDYETGWDYGTGMTAVVICQELPDEFRVIAEFEGPDLTPREAAAGVRMSLADAGVPLILTQKQWTRRMRAVGDPSGEAKERVTAKPLTANYLTEGFRITSKRRGLQDTINAVRLLLMGRPKPLVVSKRTCPKFIEHIENNTWPVDREGNPKPDPSEPVNDEHNHMMRAFAYLVRSKWAPASVDQALRKASAAQAAAFVRDGIRDSTVRPGSKL